MTAHNQPVLPMCQLILLLPFNCEPSTWRSLHPRGPVLQVYAAVDDIRSGTRMVVFGIHIGETQASWERQKLVPESLDDACALSSSGRADGALSRPGKAAASWQVWPHANTENLAELAEAGEMAATCRMSF